MKTKCILFDADGVLTNGELFSIQYQKQYNLAADSMKTFFDGPFQDCLVGKADLKEAVAPFLKDWQWTGTVDEFLAFWFKAEHHIDERMIELIKDLQGNGMKCYLATNQEKYRTLYMKKEMGFANVFDNIFSSSDIGFKKPQPEFFDYIYKWVERTDSIQKAEMFFVDNSKENVEAAVAFGIDSCLYTEFDKFSMITSVLI